MVWLAVALGGALGALARYSLFVWFAPAPGKLPLATLTANISGCFLAGMVYVLIAHTIIPLSWRPVVAIGFLGAFTTFSTFSLEAMMLWQSQLTGLAVFYVALTLVGCLSAVWFGQITAAFFSP